MSDKDNKPKIDKEAIKKLAKDKAKALNTNEIIKK